MGQSRRDEFPGRVAKGSLKRAVRLSGANLRCFFEGGRESLQHSRLVCLWLFCNQQAVAGG